MMALMSIAGLTACSSSDDATPDTPTNPGEAVKTSFTLSVGLPQTGSNAKAATRVSDEVAQATGNFRGIDNINLIPFGTEVSASSSRLGDGNITLPNTTPNSLQTVTEGGNAKVYNDVSIPVGTNHFLFYGKAIDGTATEGIAQPSDPFRYGYLQAAGLSEGTPSGITFTPQPIFQGNLSSNEVATALMTYLNGIVGTTYTVDGTQSTWAAYAAQTTNSGRPLTNLYNNLITATAGSSASVEAMVQDLFTSLKTLQNDANLTAAEGTLRDAILANIAAKATNATTAGANDKLTFDASVNNFPGNINLPDGAASLTFNNGAFAENQTAHFTADGVQTADLSNFTYPANLWYYTNTAIKTSQADLSGQYTNGNQWDAILSQYDEDNSSVSALTRSIALKNQIQYAVGRLQATVKAAASTLYDRKGNTVTVTDQTFPVTAILIGGQRQVDWQFNPDASQTATQYTMYDKAQADNYATTAGSKANNTLVLETPANEKINLVVELQNNSGKAFEGKDGFVPAGGKFYLVAQLDPSKGAKPTGAADLNQVFKQDFVTKATLTINANTQSDRNQGLGNAYNVIPDLRTPVLSIGMSVNLEWQTGLTFDVNM